MRILVVVSNYPYAEHEFTGVFNERCVAALRAQCEAVEVLAPRPYAPQLFRRAALVPRWRSYAAIKPYEVRNGVAIYRPAYIRVPRLGSNFWLGTGAYLLCRRQVREMHRRVRFDAILAFDLVAAGDLASRLGRDLGIPASCWATGERISAKFLRHLDLIFYQSRELFETAARELRLTPAQMQTERHVVLSRGIPSPPARSWCAERSRLRSAWQISDDTTVVLTLGRIAREKGIFEILEAISQVRRHNSRVICVIVGSKPEFDETAVVARTIYRDPDLRQSVRLLPACSPEDVWTFLSAADVFVFASYKEGMPNALLEAMVMSLPTVAFAIPPVLEIEAGRGGLVLVEPLNAVQLGNAILSLAGSPEERLRIGQIGRAEVVNRFMVEKNMAEALARLDEMIRRRHHVPLPLA